MTFKPMFSSFAFLAVAGLLTACETPRTRLCAPEQSLACVSVTGCSGAQTCLPDGSGYTECQCPAAAGGGTGGSAGGGAGGGAGDAGQGCPLGDWSCAALPSQTQAGGVCLNGSCTCSAGYDLTPTGKCFPSGWDAGAVTCQSAQAQCGQVFRPDAGALDCGSCSALGTVCLAGKCIVDGVPKTCAQLGLNCGPASDGLGGILACGTCVSPLSCGGGGQAGVCGVCDGGSCATMDVPKTCAQLGDNCGLTGDGLGGLLDCGTCTSPMSCGGGGVPNRCGGCDTCTHALSCAQQGFNCGTAGDGVGGTLNCGTCVSPLTCGAGGHPNVCG